MAKASWSTSPASRTIRLHSPPTAHSRRSRARARPPNPLQEGAAVESGCPPRAGVLIQTQARTFGDHPPRASEETVEPPPITKNPPQGGVKRQTNREKKNFLP